MMRAWICVIAATALLAGCSRPKPPEKDRPVEPQATQLRDAIQAPMEKARQVEGDVQEAADQQRAEIEAQGG